MDDAQKFSTLKDPPVDFPVWEAYLVGRFGIGRDRLLELREAHLVQGHDWIKSGRRVCLTQGAVEKLAAIIGLEQKTPPGETAVLPAPIPKPIFNLKVYRKPISHPNLILATDGENVFRVRVKTKTNFVPGMAIQCSHDRLDLFDHVGNCPRFRGKY